ncbi:MAG: PAS domain-containing protein [Deltaproteobacteria bacterium]
MRREPPASLAGRYDVAALERHGSPLVAIDSSGLITWTNRAWRASAGHGTQGRGAARTGASYFDAVPGDCREALARAIAECLRSTEPVERDHECRLPGEVGCVRVRLLRLDVVDVLIAHNRSSRSPEHGERISRDCNDFVVMCSNCRHVRRVGTRAWDWIPEWVATPPARVSHGICPVCHGFYWGDLI